MVALAAVVKNDNYDNLFAVVVAAVAAEGMVVVAVAAAERMMVAVGLTAEEVEEEASK